MRSPTGATTGDMTRAGVLAALTRRGPLSRADLAQALDLSPATLTRAIRRLMADGMVSETGQRPSNGGRPAILVKVNPHAAYALGLHIASDQVACVLTRLDLTVVEEFHTPFDPAGPAALDELAAIVRDRLDHARTHGRPVLGAGVSVPGVVDPRTGALRLSVRLGWSGTPLAGFLSRELDLPVLVDNDISALTSAEHLYGPGADIPDFLVAAIGQGVGLGMVLDGAPYRGFAGAAGEFGHQPLVPDGLPCTCGNRGCLETLLSTPALTARATELGLLPPGTPLSALPDTPASAELIDLAATTFARALAGTINLLDPHTVYVTGEITALWPRLAPAFHPELEARLLPSVRSTRVELRPWTPALLPTSAAALVLAAPLAIAKQPPP